VSDDLAEIEKLAGSLLRSLGATERRRLQRAMARELRASQAARIARQQAPDGSPFPPRREKKANKPGNYAVRFLYPKGAAEPRLVFMKSWVHEGPLITGFDIEAGGLRSFFWDKVDQWLPVESTDQNKGAGKLRRRGSLRRLAMFRKLRNGRNLKSGVDDLGAWVGFTGRAAQIASVHQEGGRDRPAVGAPEVRYAKRELLGTTDAERKRMLDMIMQQIAT
jgi:hypothetical protein